MAKTKKRSQPIIDLYQAFEYYCTPHSNGRQKKLKEVAEKFNITLTTAKNYSSKYKWTSIRQRLYQQRKQEYIEDKKEQIRKLNERQLKQLQKLDEVVYFEIEQTEDIQKNGSGEAKRHLVRSIDLKNLAEALEKAHKGQRVIFGVPTDIQKAEVDQINRSEPLPEDKLAQMDSFIEKNAKNDTNTKAD